MRIVQAGRYVTFNAETDGERDDLLAIAGDLAGQQLRVDTINGDRIAMRLVGPGKPEGKGKGKAAGADADTGPINIAFDDTPMPLRLVSNLAETPFEFDGRRYASVEGFWQGLKLPSDEDRARIAALSGHAAKAAGPAVRPGDRFVYEGREITVGTIDHWELMERACAAKLEQHEAARKALLSTGTRPLEHKVAVDSRTIPGIVMADIWTRLRAKLSAGRTND